MRRPVRTRRKTCQRQGASSGRDRYTTRRSRANDHRAGRAIPARPGVVERANTSFVRDALPSAVVLRRPDLRLRRIRNCRVSSVVIAATDHQVATGGRHAGYVYVVAATAPRRLDRGRVVVALAINKGVMHPLVWGYAKRAAECLRAGGWIKKPPDPCLSVKCLIVCIYYVRERSTVNRQDRRIEPVKSRFEPSCAQYDERAVGRNRDRTTDARIGVSDRLSADVTDCHTELPNCRNEYVSLGAEPGKLCRRERQRRFIPCLVHRRD